MYNLGNKHVCDASFQENFLFYIFLYMHKTSETFSGSRTDHIRITEWLCGGDGDFHPSDVISSLEHSRIQDGNPVL